MSFGKFIFKMWVVSPLRAALVAFFAPEPNRSGWEGRMLIINLEALGDLVLCTSVLKHYKQRFPRERVVLLMKSGTGLEEFFTGAFVDEVIGVNYRRLAIDPLYGFFVIRSLRRIGFRTVVNQDFSASEIMGKIMAVSVGAERVVGSDGLALEHEHPFDAQQAYNIRMIEWQVLPRYTERVPARGISHESDGCFPSPITHYARIFEQVSGAPAADYAPELAPPEERQPVLRKFELHGRRYAILNVSASVPYKRWPIDRFIGAADVLMQRGLVPVLVGTKKDRIPAGAFAARVSSCVNLVGQSSLKELIVLIAESAVVFSNDTSTTHLAVALKKPLLCIAGGGPGGMFENYGYSDIQVWASVRLNCFGDNWQCVARVRRGSPAPCVAAVTERLVRAKLAALLDYLETPEFHRLRRPAEPFRVHFEQPNKRYRLSAFGHRMFPRKIIYIGLRNDYYDPSRGPSFEYSNFYRSLCGFPDVTILEYPVDRIAEIGKERFNKELLDMVKKERPAAFFSFMFTDEFDPVALDAIKSYTTSIAWFADDHWRLHNYSRQYAPHFTWAVTTWSKAPKLYQNYGIMNIIRSQWACNTAVWHPVEAKRDIDVSFIGQYTSARERIIADLRRHGVQVWVRGWGWPEGRLSHEEMIEGFSRSKITLNFTVQPSRARFRSLARLFFKRSVGRVVPDIAHLPSNFRSWWGSGVPQIKARPFEALGCRTLLISGFADDMDRYYKDKQEIVYYDGTTRDLVSKITYYLAHEDERERIARAGYERTLREHAYENRFRELFRIVAERENHP